MRLKIPGIAGWGETITVLPLGGEPASYDAVPSAVRWVATSRWLAGSKPHTLETVATVEVCTCAR